MRLARQVGVVALTYLTRPALVIIVAVGLASVGVTFAISRINWDHALRWNSPALFIYMLLLLLPAIMTLAFIIVFMVQVREQLRGPHAAIVPGFRAAHLIVAGVIFFAIVLGLTLFFDRIDVQPTSFVGVFGIVLTILTLAALSAIASPWWLVVLVSVIALLLSEKLGGYVSLFTTDFSALQRQLLERPRVRPEWIARLRFERNMAWLARVLTLTSNALVLAWIALRARQPMSRPISARVLERWSRLLHARSDRALMRHRPVTTTISRGWHRRFAVHSHNVAWGLAAALAVVMALMLLLLPSDPRHSRAVLPLAMATIIPATAVGIGWRERWPSLGYECLYPARRDEFVNEMAVAIAGDLAEFWLATTIAGLAILAIWEPRTLLSQNFIASIIASALMQILAFGGTLLLARWRAWPLYVLAMLGLLEATFVPLMQTWRDQGAWTPRMLLLVALGEAATGLALAGLGLAAWRRAEFA